MVYHLLISLDGQNIDFNTICAHLGNDLVADTMTRKGDEISLSKTFWYAKTDYMYIEHKNKFAVPGPMVEYQKAYVDFLANNYKLLKQCGVKQVDLRFTVYVEHNMPAFQIFSGNDMKRLAKYNLSIPVDVHIRGNREMKKWEKEIELIWGKNLKNVERITKAVKLKNMNSKTIKNSKINIPVREYRSVEESTIFNPAFR